MIIWISYILFWGFLFLTPALSIGLGVHAGFSIMEYYTSHNYYILYKIIVLLQLPGHGGRLRLWCGSSDRNFCRRLFPLA